MRARIEMELEDVPGQLIKVLEPISGLGVNIQNVVHKREEKTPLGKVPVTVILEVEDSDRLEKVLDEIEGAGASITRVGEEKAAASAVIMLVGDIIQTDIRDSIDRLDEVEGARISNLNLEVGDSEEESAARVIIQATDEDSLESAVSKLREISDEKDMLMIEPLG